MKLEEDKYDEDVLECHVLLTTTTDPFWSLGTLLYEKYMVTYDLDEDKIGLAGPDLVCNNYTQIYNEIIAPPTDPDPTDPTNPTNTTNTTNSTNTTDPTTPTLDEYPYLI